MWRISIFLLFFMHCKYFVSLRLILSFMTYTFLRYSVETAHSASSFFSFCCTLNSYIP